MVPCSGFCSSRLARISWRTAISSFSASTTSGADSSSFALFSCSVSPSDSTSSVVVCVGVDSSCSGETYLSSYDDCAVVTHLLEGPALSSSSWLGLLLSWLCPSHVPFGVHHLLFAVLRQNCYGCEGFPLWLYRLSSWICPPVLTLWSSRLPAWPNWFPPRNRTCWSLRLDLPLTHFWLCLLQYFLPCSVFDRTIFQMAISHPLFSLFLGRIYLR